VEETLAPGVSVAQVARVHGVNSNQVFQWRRQYQSGDLALPSTTVPKLLPVMISDAAEEVPDEASPHGRVASIHIEFPGRALVSIEAGVDPALVAAVIERLMR
jgi:transposase